MSKAWKDIPGYEGIYEASTAGEIRTALGKTTWSSRYNKPRVWQQRVLKPKITKPKNRTRRDARVNLYKDGEVKTHLVARLIAETFLGSPNGMTVNHKDGNPLNNEVSNLEWITGIENTRHANRTGLRDVLKQSVILRNTDTGETLKFESLTSASLFMGKCKGYLSQAIRRGQSLPAPYELVKYQTRGDLAGRS